jgi:hypothetical protein
VRLPYIFGIGKIQIKVIANHIEKTASAYLLGPFILNLIET